MKKRNKYWTREKEYKALIRRSDEVRKERYELGYVELDVPRFNGYIAKLKLRDDIARRDDADVFQEIMELHGYVTFAVRLIKDFPWNTGAKRWRYSDLRYPHIKDITKHVYDSLRPQVQKHFVESRFSTWRGMNLYVCTVPSFYYDIEYVKDYITHARVIDEVLEQEDSELDKQIDKYQEEYGIYHWRNASGGAPKSFRKSLNRTERAKSKRVVRNIEADIKKYSELLSWTYRHDYDDDNFWEQDYFEPELEKEDEYTFSDCYKGAGWYYW